MIIKRIGPLSFAKLSAVLYAIMGLVVGGIFSLVALAGGFASETEKCAGIGAMIGVGAVIVAPIFYGLWRLCPRRHRMVVQPCGRHRGRR